MTDSRFIKSSDTGVFKFDERYNLTHSSYNMRIQFDVKLNDTIFCMSNTFLESFSETLENCAILNSSSDDLH